MVVCVGSVFGHISYRSDWELVKVDFRQSFPRQCSESDYESWQLMDLQVILIWNTQITQICVVFFSAKARLFSPLQPAGGEMHHGSGAKFQEEEGHVVLHQREKLHVGSEQPAVPVH